MDASSSDSLLYVSSFLNIDGSIATQAINNNTQAYEVSFKVHTRGHIGTAQPWVTNNDHDLTPLKFIRVGNDDTFKYVIPAHSMITFVCS